MPETNGLAKEPERLRPLTAAERRPVAEALRDQGYSEAGLETLTEAVAGACAVSLRPGEILIHEGERPWGAFVVREGRLVVSRILADGRRLRLRELGPGAILGEMGLLTNEPRSATVTAQVPSVVVVLPRGAFEKVLAVNPGVHACMQSLADQRHRLASRL